MNNTTFIGSFLELALTGTNVAAYLFAICFPIFFVSIWLMLVSWRHQQTREEPEISDSSYF